MPFGLVFVYTLAGFHMNAQKLSTKLFPFAFDGTNKKGETTLEHSYNNFCTLLMQFSYFMLQ